MARTYLAARSFAELHGVCAEIASAMDLPAFAFDVEDSWEYGISQGQALQLNVTKTKDLTTISTWMPKAPKGVNYQIIATSAHPEHPKHVAQLRTVLKRTLGVEVVAYEA